ncbi:hypothetical protein V2J09_002797 [Rumex salicifolius]
MKKLSPHKIFDMQVHGLLLWASLGFLMPLGVLILRMSNTNISRSREISVTKQRLFYYFHLILQILSVLLSTAGAIMSIKSFENSFSNNHQRLGLVLYCAIWAQAMLGFYRPLKESRKRGAWYFLHWLLGTTVLITGVINIYTGLKAYEKKTSKSVTVWTILFTAEVSFMAAFYLLQDKWEYIRKQQGGIFWDEPIRPSSNSDDQEMSNSNSGIIVRNDDEQQRVNGKRMLGEPCPKANGLKNLF